MIPSFNRPTLVTITGSTCSGKTYLRERLGTDYGWARIVSTTTRDQRAGEVFGHDYYFISDERSRSLEAEGKLAELVEFRGVRYGVTQDEMIDKFNSPPFTATVILEPNGLVQYRKLCQDRNIDVFSVYVQVTESVALKRLTARRQDDLHKAKFEDIERVNAAYDDRKQSIATEERRWLHTNIWDAIVPGDDIDKALDMIELGVQWRNRRNESVVA